MLINPEQNILHLGLKEGMRVADFGAGTGFYSKACSERVGNTGRVYAVEVQKDLVRKLEDEVKSWGLSNIDCIWGDIEIKGGTKISDASVDAVVLSNVLFQIENKIGLVDEVGRVLKKGGKVLVVDRNAQYNSYGNNAYFINKSDIIDLFKKRGFNFLEEISTTPNYYGIIFIRG